MPKNSQYISLNSKSNTIVLILSRECKYVVTTSDLVTTSDEMQAYLILDLVSPDSDIQNADLPDKY